MSATPLSDSREVVERSIFHAIRKETVDKGYIPDINKEETNAIIAVSTGVQTFKATTDLTTFYKPTRKFTVKLSTGNNGVYTVSSAVFALGETTITTIEPIPNPIADGFLVIFHYYDDPLGVILFNTDLTSIISTKGFAIEIFGSSNPQAKYLKKIPRIVVLPNQSLAGALGGSPDKIYTPNNGDVLSPDAYTARVLPPKP